VCQQPPTSLPDSGVSLDYNIKILDLMQEIYIFIFFISFLILYIVKISAVSRPSDAIIIDEENQKKINFFSANQ